MDYYIKGKEMIQTMKIRSGVYLMLRNITKEEKAAYLVKKQPNSIKWSLYSINFNLKFPVISGPMTTKDTLSGIKKFLKEEL